MSSVGAVISDRCFYHRNDDGSLTSSTMTGTTESKRSAPAGPRRHGPARGSDHILRPHVYSTGLGPSRVSQSPARSRTPQTTNSGSQSSA